MKGLLEFEDNKWIVIMDDGAKMEVRPGRIDDLNTVGTFLQKGTVVDYQIENIFNFPYQWAVPYVEKEGEETPIVERKLKEKLQITLYYSGFPKIERDVVVCDGWDCSGSGYYYFYDSDEYRDKTYLRITPIDKTLIYGIKKIKVEV